MSITNMHDHSEYIEDLRTHIIKHHSSLGLEIDGKPPSQENVYPIYNVTKPSVTSNPATVIMIGRFVCLIVVHETVVVKETPSIHHVHKYYAQTKPIDTSADKIGNVAFAKSRHIGYQSLLAVMMLYRSLGIELYFDSYDPSSDQETIAMLMRYGFASPTIVANLIDEALRAMMKCLPYKQFMYVASDKKSNIYVGRHANSSVVDMVQILPTKDKS